MSYYLIVCVIVVLKQTFQAIPERFVKAI